MECSNLWKSNLWKFDEACAGKVRAYKVNDPNGLFCDEEIIAPLCEKHVAKLAEIHADWRIEETRDSLSEKPRRRGNTKADIKRDPGLGLLSMLFDQVLRRIPPDDAAELANAYYREGMGIQITMLPHPGGDDFETAFRWAIVDNDLRLEVLPSASEKVC